ncbi:hypothetical protein PROFUN_02497 [Planoprotostelium fungivorum]|uniref:Uncharacterized protein n=1 Tax=Planoprotostelium fungivorum TaxID=1890364 RepID=A0A2P6MP46_9EUKA|nr:hypothetical protein PROFUN_02497 [Planoprotostelium fungivorum]
MVPPVNTWEHQGQRRGWCNPRDQLQITGPAPTSMKLQQPHIQWRSETQERLTGTVQRTEISLAYR